MRESRGSASLGKTAEKAQEGAGAGGALRRRAVVLALFLVPLLCIAVQYGEIVRGVGELVASSLVLLATTVLLLLLGTNALLRRWRPAWCFSQAELLHLFVMLSVAGSIAGVGMVMFLVPLLGHLFHYATPENRWAEFHPYVPWWMVPERSALDAFYRGQSTFFTAAHMRAWLVPLAVWSVFVFAFVSFMLSLSLLLRRQWIEKERLTFPIVYFPLELTREGGSLWRDRLLWIGFLIPLLLQSLAALNFLYPSVPHFPLKPSPQLALGRFLTSDPSSPLANITLAFYPMALGISYFVQLEVLFSFWFFYWFARLEEIICIALGFRAPGVSARMAEMPYLNQQSLGAFVALGAVALWLARGHIADAIGQALRLAKYPASAEVVGSHRTALAGLAVSGLFLVSFCFLAGIPLHIIALFFTIYFLTVLGMSRIRAEAGLPWAFGPHHPPHIFMMWGVGPRNIGNRAMTALTYLEWFDWDWRTCAMPYHMEALKIASSAGLKNRDMVKAILFASGLSIIATFFALLVLYYSQGAESGKLDFYRTRWAAMPIGLLRTWVDSAAGANWAELAGGVAGAAMVIILSWCRTRWLWWPFHPVGYALSPTWTPVWLWCPLFVVWLAKSLILRYGGNRLYRRGIPLAIGLILGDYVVTALLGLLGLVTGKQMYSAFFSA